MRLRLWIQVYVYIIVLRFYPNNISIMARLNFMVDKRLPTRRVCEVGLRKEVNDVQNDDGAGHLLPGTLPSYLTGSRRS